MANLHLRQSLTTGMPVIPEQERLIPGQKGLGDVAKWEVEIARSGLVVLSGITEDRISLQKVPPPEIKDQGKIFGPQLLDEFVVFPKADHIVLRDEGVFIPRSIFGRDAQLTCTQQGEGAALVVTVSVGSEQVRHLKSTGRTSELEWLEEHGEEYVGQWVALDGDRLVAASPKATDVFREIRKSNVDSPFVVKVEPEAELPFGGW